LNGIKTHVSPAQRVLFYPRVKWAGFTTLRVLSGGFVMICGADAQRMAFTMPCNGFTVGKAICHCMEDIAYE
jgi:hypothetical protein